MSLRIFIFVCAVLVSAGARVALGSTESPTTPQEVWADFDPRAEPLEMEVLKRWTKGGANYTEFYFTGMTNGAERVRLYGIYSAPIGGSNLPAVLHIHGGGQTVNEHWLRFWNSRGYAALTYNWGGEWTNRPKAAQWGSLKQGNQINTTKMAEAVKPSVRVASWYLWARVSRRALTVLEQQPEVDTNRMGIFGISMGGTIVWPFAAMDKRVKAACAIYGVGWNTYPDEIGAPDPKADDADVKLWRAIMAPEAYAPLVTCPMLFLDASNDQHGKMDWAFGTLNAVPAECRWVFNPRYRHHIAATQENDLPLWMDTWLKGIGLIWPKTPSVSLTLDRSGIPKLMVAPDASWKIQRVELLYAVENRNPKNRFWRSADSRPAGRKWTALLPIAEASQPLFAYANVYYDSNVCLSSPLVTVIPSKLGKVKLTDTHSLLIDDFSHGTGDWVALWSATDPIPPVACLVTNGVGPGGKPGITIPGGAQLVTHKVGDPKWRGPDGSKLQFQAFTRTKREFTIVVHENEMTRNAHDYLVQCPLSASEDWQDVTLSAGDFKDAQTNQLENWRRVQQLEIRPATGKGPQPLYTGFRWVPEAQGAGK